MTDTLRDLQHLESMYIRNWEGQLARAAVELEVFTKLSGGKKMTIKELSEACGIQLRKPSEFFHGLVTIKLLDRDNDGFFFNTAATEKYYNRERMDTYIGSYLVLLASSHSPFNRAPQTLTQPVNYDMKGDFHQQNEVNFFNEAMMGLSMGAIIKVPSMKEWRKYKTFTDVGGSKAHMVCAIIKENPHIRGVCADLVDCKADAEKYIVSQDMQDQARFQSIDFHKEEFAATDAIIICHCFLNWYDAVKTMLIKKSFAAIPSGGMLMIVDFFMDDAQRDNSAAQLMSLNMVYVTEGHCSRVGDIMRVMADTGFVDIKYEKIATNGLIMGFKP